MFSFDDIGKKIKIFSKMICWCSIIFCILVGFKTFIDGLYHEDISSLAIGVIEVVLLPVVSWMGSVMLYGIGQLIENTNSILQSGFITPRDLLIFLAQPEKFNRDKKVYCHLDLSETEDLTSGHKR